MLKKILSIIIVLCVMSSTMCVYHSIIQYFFHDSLSVTVIPHNMISSFGYRVIYRIVQELYRFGYGMNRMIRQLKAECGWIDAVIMSCNPNGISSMYVQPHIPIAQFSRDTLLLSNGMISPLRWYNQSCITDCLITCYQEEVLNSHYQLDIQSVAWVRNIPDNIKHNYQIIWYDPMQILLIPKQNTSQVSYLVTTMMTWRTIDKIFSRLYNSLPSYIGSIQTGTCIADVRFDNRIIIKKRGTKYEANTS